MAIIETGRSLSVRFLVTPHRTCLPLHLNIRKNSQVSLTRWVVGTLENLSRADLRKMHFLVGSALLYEDLRHDLLKRERRRVLVEHIGVSPDLYRFLMTIEDAGSVEELAGEVHKKLGFQ